MTQRRQTVRQVRCAVIAGALGIALSGCGGDPSGAPAEGSPAEGASTATSTPAATQAKGSWTMPDETGKNLQRAQDDMQALTGNPLFYSASQDLTGKARQQIWDRNWKVCSSNPPPGETVTSSTRVVFGVVRDSENCP